MEFEYKRFQSARHLERHNPAFIPVRLTGGIGDVIISVDAVKRLSQDHLIVVYTEHLEAFEYFYPDKILAFKDMPNYTWRIDLNQTSKFYFEEGFYKFLSGDHEKLFLKQRSLFKQDPMIEKITNHNEDKYFVNAMYSKEKGWDRTTLPLRSLGYDDVIPFFSFPREVPSNYITIHDGYDTNASTLVSGRSTKQWDIDYWRTLVNALHTEHPDYEIIQLGSSTSRPIEGVDKCLINQTTLTQAFQILSRSMLHIDGDSGLVHAATRMNVPCVVMFGPTPDYFYGYPQNMNLRSAVCKEPCFWTTKTWMDKCPKEYSEPVCMNYIQPSQVLATIDNLWKRSLW